MSPLRSRPTVRTASARALSRALVVVLCAAPLALIVVPAQAHAVCDTAKASPPEGARVDSPPSDVYCDFTEPPADNSTMEVVDACGDRADDGNVVIVGLRMGVRMKATAPSTYTVRWTATSSLDGHKTFGSWTYTVTGKPASCGTVASPSARPTPTEKASRAPRSTPSAVATPTRTSGRPGPTTTTAPDDVVASPSPSRTGVDPLSEEGALAAGAATAPSSPVGVILAVVGLLGVISIAAARTAADRD